MYTGYIYRHWIINDEGIEKSYVGLTIQPLNRRWRNGNSYLQRDTKFSRAIIKYGWDSFTHEVLEVVEKEDIDLLVKTLKQLEMEYIEKFNSFKEGYNMTRGGDDVGLNKGETHHFYEKHHSEETKKKISESRKVFYHSGGEHPRGMLGKTHSEEYKELLRTKTGEKNHFFGKTHSDETKRKISETLKERGCCKGANNPSAKSVICIETGEVFNTMKDACAWCGLKYATTIIKACKNSDKTAGRHPDTQQKLHWRYGN